MPLEQQLSVADPASMVALVTDGCRLFSRYYNRVRILPTRDDEPLPPTLYARIHLLRCLHAALQRVLDRLGLQALARV